LRGDHTIARFIARWGEPTGDPIYPSSAFVASSIDQWLQIALQDLAKNSDPKNFFLTCDLLNKHLCLRTFFCEYSVSLADIAIWAALRVHPNLAALQRNKKLVNVNRWFSYCESLPQFAEIIKQYKLSPQQSKDSSGKRKVKMLQLTGATEGNVCTRFPPEPSGYLHLGHIKAALLNSYYAETYKGKLLLRFDDTNPKKENVEFVDAITEDLKTIGFKPDAVSYTSDHFQLIQDYAVKMIQEGKAYVDLTEPEEMKKMRMARQESQYRNQSVEENMALWKEMVEGTDKGKTAVLRAKIDMSSSNGCMRDPSMYRVVDSPPHHRTGTKFKVYPTYDFACPIVDSFEGVTHPLRSNEYHDRNFQYEWFIENLGIRAPIVEDFSRLNFQYTLLSKRKLQWFVDNGIVSGWDSPAFPTVRGIMRRGLTLEALRQFILSQGSSKNDNMQEMERVWAINKRIIDPIIPRYTALAEDNRVLVTLVNGPEEVEYRSIAKHKKNASLGKKTVAFSNRIFLEQEDAQVVKEGEEVTLKDWGNAIIKEKTINEEGVVTGMQAELHLEGDFTKTKWKLTWLADTPDLVPVKLVEYDYLITKKKLDKGDNFRDYVNPNIENVTMAVGDQNLRGIQKGERLQLERRGYFVCDEMYRDFEDQPLVLFLIPDGSSHRQSHLSSKIDPGAKQHERQRRNKNN